MSKESDQAITMLSIIMGGMLTMTISKSFAKIELKKAIEQSGVAAKRARDNWPIRYNKPWIKERYKQFVEVVNPPDRTDEYTPIEMTLVAERLAIDLQDMYPFGLRGELVKPILPGIKVLLEHMDPNGTNYGAMDAASENMDKLYEILGIQEEQFGKVRTVGLETV